MDDLSLQQRLGLALEATDFLEDGSEERTKELNAIRVAIKTALIELVDGEAGSEYSAIATLEQVIPELNRLSFAEADTEDRISGTFATSSYPPPETA